MAAETSAMNPGAIPVPWGYYTMRLMNRLGITIVMCAVLALGISTTLNPAPGVLNAQAQSSDEISVAEILDAILDDGISASNGMSDLDPVARATTMYLGNDFQLNNGSFAPTGAWHRSILCADLLASGHTAGGSLYVGTDGSCDYVAVASTTDTVDSSLGAIDLSGTTSNPVLLTFNYFLDTDGTGDIASVRVSTDGGTTFPFLVAGNGGTGTALTDDGTWNAASVDISAHIGISIILRFEFATDASTGTGDGFYVDDVVVSATDPVVAGGGGGGSGAGPCFIATAAYGTPLAHDIDALRSVRDTYLLNNLLGAAFVDTYYRSSPIIADWVSRYPVVASGVRLALVPVVALSRLALTAPLALSVLLLVTGVTVQRIRSRKIAGAV